MTTSIPSPDAQARRPGHGGRVQQVVAQLSQSLQDGSLQPGDRLPSESAIMAQLSVSRTVVREAISHLQASGLVETRHGIGTFALSVPAADSFRIASQDLATVDDVIAVLELRIGLEAEAASLAAQRAGPAHLTALARALHEFSTAIDASSDAVPGDFEFHMGVAKASGNRHFVELMTHLGTRIIPRSRVNTPPQAPDARKAYLLRVHGEHESIYNAIRNRDSDAARAAMRTHLSNSRDRLRKAREQAF